MLNKHNLITVGVVAGIALLLGVAASLNPKLFQGFVLYQPDVIVNPCDAECQELQNEVLEVYEAVDLEESQKNEELQVRLLAVDDQCGCNGLKQVYIDGLNLSESAAAQTLLSFGFDCSDHVYSSECVELTKQPEDMTCSEKVNYAIQKRSSGDMSESDFKTFMIRFFVFPDANGSQCTCDQVYQILDALNFSDKEARKFMVQSDVIRCSARASNPDTSNPGVSMAIPPSLTPNPTVTKVPGDTPSAPVITINPYQSPTLNPNIVTTIIPDSSGNPDSNPANTPLGNPGLQTNPPAYDVCDARQAQIIVRFLDTANPVPSDFLTTTLKALQVDCGCEKSDAILDWIGYDQEGKNDFYTTIGANTCLVNDPVLTPTCEDYRQNAFDALQEYRGDGQPDALADALESMLIIDQKCCNSCGCNPGDDSSTTLKKMNAVPPFPQLAVPAP